MLLFTTNIAANICVGSIHHIVFGFYSQYIHFKTLHYEFNSNPLEYGVYIQILSRLPIKHLISSLYSKVCKSISIHPMVNRILSIANYILSSMC